VDYVLCMYAVCMYACMHVCCMHKLLTPELFEPLDFDRYEGGLQSGYCVGHGRHESVRDFVEVGVFDLAHGLHCSA
jgi:hypothetical protein